MTREGGKPDQTTAVAAPKIKRSTPAALLQSEEIEILLNIIDKLRSQRITQEISLPQIIVCGDQSSGKSSVLEAVSNVSFPTKDNLCTRFATEVILRRDTKVNLQVTIQPGKTRTLAERKRFNDFTAPADSLDRLPELIDRAQKCMGISTDHAGANFSDDVLQVQVSGPTQPHLTLVDLPGLFHAHDQKQSAEDADLVLRLVKNYMKNKRGIILAVISAKNDVANQIVTKYAREIDPDGSRTLGVITKPDMLHVGSDSEKAFVQLAKNTNIKFRLGWHVVRNKDFNEKGKDRDEIEDAFFSEGMWKTLPRTHVGVSQLSSRLTTLLYNHIRQELSSLMQEIRDKIENHQKELRLLGDPRPTLDEQRSYLIGVAERFTNLVQSAINGNYDDELFGNSNDHYDRRIRAVASNASEDFAKEMRRNGARHTIVDENHASDYKGYNLDDIDSPVVLRKTYLEHVRKELRKNKGRELPGLLNPLIVGQLFKLQSSPWHKLIDNFCEGLFYAIVSGVKEFLFLVTDQSVCDGLYHLIVAGKVNQLKQNFQDKIAEFLRPLEYGHPQTYDTTLAQKVARARETHRENRFEQEYDKVMNDAKAHNRPSDQKTIFMELRRRWEEPDPELHSCHEACYYMESYYEVAQNALLEDVTRLGIEQCVLQPLRSVLNSRAIFSLSSDQIQLIAGESEEIVAKRAELQQTVDTLSSTVRSLEGMAIPTRRIEGLSYQDPFKRAFSTQTSSQDYGTWSRPPSKKIKMQ